jgi:hypothetical protein
MVVYPDDVFLVSYPKSGNTWLRFLVANLTRNDTTTTFENVNGRISDIYQASEEDLLAMTRPRILKSHEYLDPRYPRVIYVVRDVRNVIVSYYHYSRRIGSVGWQQSIQEFTNNFLEGRLNRYGTWVENVASWVKVRGPDRDRFLLLRYEAVTLDTLTTIAEFLQLERSPAECELAWTASSFERMRELEARAGARWIDTAKAAHPEIPFMRAGQASRWDAVLDEETLASIEAKCGGLMAELGYRW